MPRTQLNIGKLRPAQRRSGGFTLIELLVVIAIIAILTAIIFPVFATLRENARQKTSMANLENIQKGLAQFKLDNGRYPDVLFGYAYPTAPGATTFVRMDKALAQAEADGQAQSIDIASQYFPGLYPEYVPDVTSFTDSNNLVRDYSKASPPLNVNVLSPTPNPAIFALSNPPPQRQFYLTDAYDISPEIDGSKTNTFLPNNSQPSYVVRYQKSWTDVSPTATKNYDNSAATPAYNTYTHQLRWQNPPADTYITCTTDHVPNSNKVLVVWESGAAKSIDASRFLAGSAGDCSQTDSASANSAFFWQVSPTDNANRGYPVCP